MQCTSRRPFSYNHRQLGSLFYQLFRAWEKRRCSARRLTRTGTEIRGREISLRSIVSTTNSAKRNTGQRRIALRHSQACCQQPLLRNRSKHEEHVTRERDISLIEEEEEEERKILEHSHLVRAIDEKSRLRTDTAELAVACDSGYTSLLCGRRNRCRCPSRNNIY